MKKRTWLTIGFSIVGSVLSLAGYVFRADFVLSDSLYVLAGFFCIWASLRAKPLLWPFIGLNLAWGGLAAARLCSAYF